MEMNCILCGQVGSPLHLLDLGCRVKDLPKSYGRPIHTYYWILDKETIVKRINLNDEIEKPLPQPTKLNLTHLANVAQLIPTSSAKIGLSLQTKFNTTIRIDPCYPKALELLDWCIFQIDLTDVTGSMIALISGELSEKMLSMTTEDIFDTTCVKMQLLRLDHIHQILSNKSFNIQLKKSSWELGPLFCDCGMYDCAFTEFINHGVFDSQINKFTATNHHMRYGALLWDYARKKQNDGAISESEVTDNVTSRLGGPKILTDVVSPAVTKKIRHR
ncbi:hypothetical protein T459_01432 [Capsicum annuum]|uniref:Uncharacterized protein n=1 Tax=Capsicum annuum TaxID=4072 RepID=A0A2G3AH67_CAPAN|nr:hypothetical protein FXO37_26228 [Capsicum annuum]PHT93550.1 hypothetical protein T459_01432 [Capsicum annuum]